MVSIGGKGDTGGEEKGKIRKWMERKKKRLREGRRGDWAESGGLHLSSEMLLPLGIVSWLHACDLLTCQRQGHFDLIIRLVNECSCQPNIRCAVKNFSAKNYENSTRNASRALKSNGKRTTQIKL